MKNVVFILIFAFSFIGRSQNNYIVKTEDGRRVLLKSNFTWEYIDITTNNTSSIKSKQAITDEITQSVTLPKSPNCNVSSDFKEPKGDRNVQSHLKKGRATIKHIKRKVAKDFNCNVEDILLLNVREQKNQGSYTFCANGTQVNYKRTGFSFAKKGKLF